MRKILALSLIAIIQITGCIFSAKAENKVYVHRSDMYYAEPYYHKSASCSFGLSLASDTVWQVKCSSSTAAKNNCRPCPVCAYVFKPRFTSTFPKWTGKTPPYHSGGDKHYLSVDILRKFGDASAAIEEWCKTRNPSVNYAGVFKNDSGTYTVLMTNPSAARVSSWKKALRCDFWVIEAKYSEKQLDNLLSYATTLIGRYEINTVGIEMTANRVGIGTNDNSVTNMKLIYTLLKSKGYPIDAVWIYKSFSANDIF